MPRARTVHRALPLVFLLPLALLAAGCGGTDRDDGLPPSGRLDEWMRRAVAFEEEGDLPEALSAYRGAARRFPTEAWPWSGVGRVSRALGRDREAEEAFLQAVRWDSTRVADHEALARIALDDGRVDVALARVDEALRRGGDDPVRSGLRGRVLAEAGRVAEARPEIDRAMLRAPDAVEVRIARIVCRLAADSARAAAGEADDLVARVPDVPDVRFVRARVRQALDDVAGAREDLEAGLAVAPHRTRARLALAALLRADGDPAAAAEQYRAILEDDPRQAAALEGLGACALATGDPEAAEFAFREAIRLDPENARAHLGLGRFLAATDRPDSAVAHLRRARARASLDAALWEECSLELCDTYLARGEAGHALDVADAVLERAPESAPARAARGRALAAGGGGATSGDALERIASRPEATRDEVLAWGGWLLERGEAERARTVAERWLETHPGDVEARTFRARALQLAGRTDDAEIELHEVLAGDRPVPSARLALARLYLEQERWPDAIFHATEGAKLAPDDPRFLEVLGLAAMAWERPNDAREAFETERALRPDEPEPYLHLGQLAMRLGNPGEAATWFERARAQDPESWVASHSLGLALAADGRPQEAVEAYRAALAVDERIVESHNNLAWLLADLDLDPILAEVHARRAAELAPGNPDVLGTLGWAQYKNRLLDEAAGTLAEATAQRPEDPMKHWMQAVVAFARGDRDAAKREAETALALDPQFPRAASARDLLARLGG